jgi:uncharacterized protein (DUF111 family)
MTVDATTGYIQAQTLVNDLCNELAAALETHMDGIDPEHVNWGHVGDLNHVADLIGNAVAFLTGNEDN